MRRELEALDAKRRDHERNIGDYDAILTHRRNQPNFHEVDGASNSLSCTQSLVNGHRSEFSQHKGGVHMCFKTAPAFLLRPKVDYRCRPYSVSHSSAVFERVAGRC